MVQTRSSKLILDDLKVTYLQVVTGRKLDSQTPKDEDKKIDQRP